VHGEGSAVLAVLVVEQGLAEQVGGGSRHGANEPVA
jgi:hypothetical protein